MERETYKPIRWRLHFSMRTLAIFVTLLGVYFSAWEATKRYGVPQTYLTAEEQFERNRTTVSTRIVNATSPMPFIICQEEREVSGSELSHEGLFTTRHIRELHTGRQYYLWLFGPKIKLRFEPEWKPDHGGIF